MANLCTPAVAAGSLSQHRVQESACSNAIPGFLGVVSSPGSRGWLRHTPTRRRSRSVRIPHAVQQQSIHGDTRGVVQVRFHVPGFRLAGYGDTLRVCGENAVLGSWSVAAAPRMRWEAGDNWSVTLPLAPGTHEFKLVRVSRNGSVHWERGPNRHISVPGHVSSMLVTVSGGQPTVTEDSPPPDTVVDEAQKMLESLLREKYTLKSKVTGLERSLQERDQRLHQIISALETVEAAGEGTGWADLQQPITSHLGGIGEALRLPSTPTATNRRRGAETSRPPISRPKFAPPRKPPAAGPPAVAEAPTAVANVSPPPPPPAAATSPAAPAATPPRKDAYVEGELLQVSSSVASRAHQVLQRLEETVNEAAAVLGVLGAEAGAAAAAAAPRGNVMEQLDSTVGELAAALHVDDNAQGSRAADQPEAVSAAAVIDTPLANVDDVAQAPLNVQEDMGPADDEDQGRDGGTAVPPQGPSGGPPPPPFAAAPPELPVESSVDAPPAYWSQDLDADEDEDDGLTLPPLSPLSSAPAEVPYPSAPSAQLQALLQRELLPPPPRIEDTVLASFEEVDDEDEEEGDAMDDAAPALVLPPQQLRELSAPRAEAPAASEGGPLPPPDEVVERMVLTSRDEVEDLEVPMAELLGEAIPTGPGWIAEQQPRAAQPVVDDDIAVAEVIEDVVLTSADSVEDLVLPMEQALGVDHNVDRSEVDSAVETIEQEVVEEVVLTDDDVVEEVVMDLQEVLARALPPPPPMARPESDTVVPLNVLLDVVEPEPVQEEDTQDAEASLEEVFGPAAALLSASRRAAMQKPQQADAVFEELVEEDVLEVVEEMEEQELVEVVEEMEEQELVEVVEEMEEQELVEVVEEMQKVVEQDVIEVVEELHIDDTAVVDMVMDMRDVLRGAADADKDDDGLLAARARLDASMDDDDDHQRDTTDAMASLMEGLSDQQRQEAAARVVASIDEALAAFASSLQPAARAALESARSAAVAAGSQAEAVDAAEVEADTAEAEEIAVSVESAVEDDARSFADAGAEQPAEEAASIKEEADAIAQKLQAYEDVIARILRYEPVDAPLGLATGLPGLRSSEEEEDDFITEAVLEKAIEVVDEAVEVVNAAPDVVDEAVEVVDEAPEVVDEAVEVVDAAPEVVDEAVEVVDEAPEVVDEAVEVVDAAPEVVDEAVEVVDKAVEVVDEASEVVEEDDKAMVETEEVPHIEEPEAVLEAVEAAEVQASPKDSVSPVDVPAPLQKDPHSPPSPLLRSSTPRPMDIAGGVTRSADALALARASLDRSILESEGALEDLDELLQDLDAEKQQLKQSASLFEEVVQAKLAKAGNQGAPSPAATKAEPVNSDAAAPPPTEEEDEDDDSSTAFEDIDAETTPGGEPAGPTLVLEEESAPAASLDADETLRTKAAALMATRPQPPPAGPLGASPAPPQVAPPPPPPPPAAAAAAAVAPAPAAGGGWLGRIVRGWFGQPKAAPVQAGVEQPTPKESTTKTTARPTGAAPPAVAPPANAASAAAAAPSAVEAVAAPAPVPPVVDEMPTSSAEVPAQPVTRTANAVASALISPPVPGPLPPGLFGSANGNGNGGAANATLQPSTSALPSQTDSNTDRSAVDRSQLVGNDGGEGFEPFQPPLRPSINSTDNATVAPPSNDLTSSVLGVMQDLENPMFTARPPSPDTTRTPAVRVLPNGRPPLVEEAPVADVLNAVQRAAQQHRDRNQPIVFTVARALGISPVDPESRKLYEILTGRSYSTDHRMRDWLARSLAVEDASVEAQAPTFLPLVESFTSDEEDELTGRRKRSLQELTFSKGFVGAALITAVTLVWESTNTVLYQPLKARIVPPDKSREIADVLFVTFMLLGVIRALKD